MRLIQSVIFFILVTLLFNACTEKVTYPVELTYKGIINDEEVQVFTAAGEIDATNIALVNDLLANDLYLEREADAFDKVTLTSETTADFSDTDFTTDEVAIFSDVNYTNIDGTYTFNVNFNGVTLAYQATGDASSLTFANHVYMVKAADGFDYSSSGPQEINILGDPYDLAEGDTLVIKNYSLSYGE